MRQLHPTATDTTIEVAYREPLGTRAGAPWVGLCMVASIDGSTVVGGDSSELSSTNDSAVLHQLRSIADVVIVGAGTVRGEGYGPPRTPRQRIGVVTGSGDVDTSTALFRTGAGFLITTEAAPVGAGVDVIRAGRDRVDLRAAIAQLERVHDAPRFVQAEGGAQLNGALLDADLLDEINVTTSPSCVGGAGPRLAEGAGDLERRYDLARLVIDDESFLYCRWRRRRR
jgi:riboflavin biosynthesis pyrimidine reductase